MYIIIQCSKGGKYSLKDGNINPALDVNVVIYRWLN